MVWIQCSVSCDLGPNCLQRSSKDDKIPEIFLCGKVDYEKNQPTTIPLQNFPKMQG